MKTNLYNKIRNYLIIFIICAVLSLFTGCSANGGEIDNGTNQSPSNEPDVNDEMVATLSITYNNEQYQIYKMPNVTFINSLGDVELSGVIYYYNELNIGLDALEYENWSINYKLNDNNIDPSKTYNKDFIEQVYDGLRPTIEEYQYEFDCELDFYDSLYNIEKEFKVQTNKNFGSIITLDAYLPFIVKNVNTKVSNYIYVPIKSLLGYRLGNNTELICDNLSLEIEYYELISINGVRK